MHPEVTKTTKKQYRIQRRQLALLVVMIQQQHHQQSTSAATVAAEAVLIVNQIQSITMLSRSLTRLSGVTQNPLML